MRTPDLVIRGGEVHDGTGAPGTVADVAVTDGVITDIGVVADRGQEEINASGQIVTPGFIDVHTHYDGQATWENRMTPSSNHGVTSVVMGNCGVGFAPCRPDEHDMLVELMEGVEDIPEVVMTEGLEWDWETFPDYLDALGRRRFDIDVAAQIPHSAVRVYVMGERGARAEPPTSDDLLRMRALTAESIAAGALGISTSRNMLHRTKAGAPAPSLHSEEDELAALAQGLADAGAGVFQIIPDILGDAAAEFALMRRLAETAERPLSFSLLQIPAADPSSWRTYLDLLERANAEGVEMRAQVYPRPVGFLFGLDLSFHPFALHPSFQPVANLPLAEKVAALRDPTLRGRLLAEEPASTNPISLHVVSMFTSAYVMGDPPNYEPNPSDRIELVAARHGVSPHGYVYDRFLEDEGRTILFLPAANYADGDLRAARHMLGHEHTVLGLGDGGAHYGMVCDASFPTYYLERWVRDAPADERIELPDAIRALTDEPARTVGLEDRGRLVVGHRADVNVIDLHRLRLHTPTVVHDLPAGGRRLRQEADGYVATIKSGQVTYRDGQPTGALPGVVVRGAQPAPPTRQGD